MIYTPYGYKIRRKAGFCDNPFEVVVCGSEEESGVDLIGSFVPESDTEIDFMDQKQDGPKKGKDHENG